MEKEVDTNTLEAEVVRIRKMYKEMLDEKTTDTRRGQLVEEFMKLRKPDGSFSTIDDYHIDSDCVVYYALIPTYSITAALVYADLKGIGTKESKEALLGGLKFAAELRGLIGHGFDATHDLLEAIDIYKRAGIYKWLRKNDGKAPEFQSVISKRVLEMKHALAEGRTYAGWDEDFSKQFTEEVEDFEREMYDYVWYVSYGSNLSRERFLRYINRCSDTSAPVEDKAKVFNFSLYFAAKTSIWGDGKGGAAFIDDSKEGLTLCRMYKITRRQFEEVMEKEGEKYTRKVDLDPTMQGDCPCYTLTAPSVYEETNAPCQEYFDTILTGLKEMYPETSEPLLRFYLLSRCVSEDDIKALSQIRRSEHAIKNTAITGIRTKKKHMNCIKRLAKLGLIQEDSRSVRDGLKITDYDALLYTVKEARELVDMLLIGASMKGGMNA